MRFFWRVPACLCVVRVDFRQTVFRPRKWSRGRRRFSCCSPPPSPSSSRYPTSPSPSSRSTTRAAISVTTSTTSLRYVQHFSLALRITYYNNNNIIVKPIKRLHVNMITRSYRAHATTTIITHPFELRYTRTKMITSSYAVVTSFFLKIFPDT